MNDWSASFFHFPTRTNCAPATREAHDTFLRLQEEDKASAYCPFDDEMADEE